MLRRIQSITDVGLFHNANGAPHQLAKATLVYAENGRGKSTLASVLQSCSTGDPAIINNRKTLDGVQTPGVHLQFDHGIQINFANGAWSAVRSDIRVFDAAFIEKNVYSGAEVRADQRQGLLEFALGQQAVAARALVDDATTKMAAATQVVSAADRALAGYREDMPLNEFVSLPLVEDADSQIEALKKRIAAATSNIALQQKASPTPAIAPTLDLDAFFSILRETLEEIEADAENRVRTHVMKHGGDVVVDWISRGQAFQSDQECPFCGQSVDGNDLVKAYRTYFNQAYGELKRKVSVLVRGIDNRLAEHFAEQIFSAVEKAQAISDGWNEHIPSTKHGIDKEKLYSLFAELREALTDLANAKQQNPLEAIGTDADKENARSVWAKILELVQHCNQSITTSVETIATFKKKLAAEQIPILQQQMNRLARAKIRHQPQALALIQQRSNALAERTKQEAIKAAARAALDKIMAQTLKQYEQRINVLLGRFGASFEIAELKFNYFGASPRSEYGLRMRGRDVRLSGGTPSFSTALSDGDKRTLAFAFFIASVEADASLNNLIVVIDDPMCSLDRNRREQTRRVLKDLASNTKQLIVLGHDLYFLRDLRDDLTPKDGSSHPQLIKLARVQNNYTGFTNLDIDQECEAEYYRNHRLLAEFSNGAGNVDPRTVAKAIRPMLEGYLHRRFPGRIKKGWMFGNIVLEATNATAPDPLAHLQTLVPILNEVNGYAGRFHHDTNAAADAEVVVDAELKNYVDRALDIVHKGTP